jgi:hypothetical protein
VDQRGLPRPAGAACDIGAYEAEDGDSADTGSSEEAESSPSPTPESETEDLIAITINFNADSYSLEAGDCTRLRWQVEGAEEVFLGGQSVPATEAEQVCPTQTTTYQLTAGNAEEEQQAFVTIEVATLEPPAAPGQFGLGQVVCNGNEYTVPLSWIDQADNEDGYRLYRDGQLIATLNANAKGYTDSPPATGFSVEYGLEAFNQAGASNRVETTEGGCLY